MHRSSSYSSREDLQGESRPLLSHGLARATASFARLKSLSGPSYDATAASEAGGEASSPGALRETWHRCQADVGVAPALLAHFALGTGTFLQGCVPARRLRGPSGG